MGRRSHSCDLKHSSLKTPPPYSAKLSYVAALSHSGRHKGNLKASETISPASSPRLRLGHTARPDECAVETGLDGDEGSSVYLG